MSDNLSVGRNIYGTVELTTITGSSTLSIGGITTFGDALNVSGGIVLKDTLSVGNEAKFTEKIKCIYIDPPYNRGTKHAHYADARSRSAWLEFMARRLVLLRRLLRACGAASTASTLLRLAVGWWRHVTLDGPAARQAAAASSA